MGGTWFECSDKRCVRMASEVVLAILLLLILLFVVVVGGIVGCGVGTWLIWGVAGVEIGSDLMVTCASFSRKCLHSCSLNT